MGYDDEISALVVRMPDFITLNMLKRWKDEFLLSLNQIVGQEKVALLIDTNTHQFESIACLKLLRDLTNEPQVIGRISRVAFVGPSQYKQPEVVNSSEAYFSQFEKAHNWLRQHVSEES